MAFSKYVAVVVLENTVLDIPCLTHIHTYTKQMARDRHKTIAGCCCWKEQTNRWRCCHVKSTRRLTTVPQSSTVDNNKPNAIVLQPSRTTERLRMIPFFKGEKDRVCTVETARRWRSAEQQRATSTDVAVVALEGHAQFEAKVQSFNGWMEDTYI